VLFTCESGAKAFWPCLIAQLAKKR
jgi:hypothetical protein